MAELIELREMIEKLRDKMNEVALKKTLTDPEVVRASQMLDVLLTEYQRMLNEKINR
ncbi:aspartyl-phosphate phosphatase Spo0E family protein [Sporomusa sp. KB1]|jgi:hypothetical protein|uniref:aspartyl-phosphate phosphatase Spo0E family protein n=1 Tax=Sporomusa sp. KB1 TaxID=943346 RepID=UPI0011A0DC31|nr:aspartyl-phosphate phosphatase Spo0E family protein [Sporomusa sp. KB1]TWH49444.1 Spo0E like sporulation regulatory protein [Sporomusa sp. KB1]